MAEDSNRSVILSVIGHDKKDASGAFLLEQYQCELLKPQDNFIIYRVVLDSDGKHSGNKVFPRRPLGFSPDTSPSKDWLNFYTLSFYPHLKDIKVSHIVAHAPEFAWGAIQIKTHLFPCAKLVLVIHEAVIGISRSNGNRSPVDVLSDWIQYADSVVSVGRQNYETVENIIFSLSRNQCDGQYVEKHLCFFPSAPKIFESQLEWTCPPTGQTPVVVILGADKATQDLQKMNLDLVLSALSSLAECMAKMHKLRKIEVRIIGVPHDEHRHLEEHLKQYINNYVRLNFSEAFELEDVRKELQMAQVCLLPLGCATDAYGLDIIVPAMFGIPLLVPDAASIVSDLTRYILKEDTVADFNEMIVPVLDAKSEEEEKAAWERKIRYTLLNQATVAQVSSRVRTVLKENDLLANCRTEFPELFTRGTITNGDMPTPMLRYEYCLLGDPEDTDCWARSIAVAGCRNSAVRECSSPPPQKKRLENLIIDNWIEFVETLDLKPLVDILFSEKALNYCLLQELRQIRLIAGRQDAIRRLLEILLRRGEDSLVQFKESLKACGYDELASILDAS